jgi:hypothetical protein
VNHTALTRARSFWVRFLERQLKCSIDEAMVSIDHLAELGCVALNYQNPHLKPFGTLLMNVVSG